jgi:hypothetical protein
MASAAASLTPSPAPRPAGTRLRAAAARLRAFVGRWALLGALVLPVAAAGCTDPCLALAQKLCDCQTTELGKQNCLTSMLNSYQAARQSDLSAAAPECAKLVDKCDCHKLDTEAGKQACGLSR